MSKVSRSRRCPPVARGLFWAWILATAFGVAAGRAQAPASLTADIPAQPLAAALADYARQSGLQLVYVSDLVTAHRTKGAQAGLSAADALRKLLDGTGLSFQFINARTVQILAAAVASARTPPAASTAGVERHRKSTTSTADSSEDVLITASLRDDSLFPDADVQNAAASVTVLDGDSLNTRKLEQLTDYMSDIPGLSLDTSGSPSDLVPIIRGIAPFQADSTVVYYLDDTPFGATGSISNAPGSVLDLMPFDLEQLEVQRGPQGTHNGATAQGGTIRYVLKKPSFGGLVAQVGGDVSSVHGACSPGSSMHLVINAPIVDERLAVRINAYDSYTPGYIDNAYTGARNVNALQRYGGRIAALWQASGSLSVQTTAFWNRIEAQSLPDVSSGGFVTVPNTGNAYIVKTTTNFGDLTENRAFLEPRTQNLDLYSATVHWDAGPIVIQSATSWSRSATRSTRDVTEDNAFRVPAILELMKEDLSLEKFTEELRFESPQGRRVDWLLGGFYSHENATGQDTWYAYDTSYRPVPDPNPDNAPVAYPAVFEERALYGELTWHLTDRLDTTGGIRYDHNHQFVAVYISGDLVDWGPKVEDATTWAAVVRYHIAPDVMLYGRVATGSQPGVPNGQYVPSPGAESLISYESGLKSQFLDRKALLNFTVFYIDWRDIILYNYGAGANLNDAAVRSKGAELLASYAPLPGLKLGYVAAYTQSEWTQLPAESSLLKGYQLPQVPKWSMSFSADFDWLLSNAWHAQVGTNLRYVGRDWSLFVQGPPSALGPCYPGGRPTIEKPSYSVLDLHGGIAKDALTIKVFARNVFDARAILHSNLLGPCGVGGGPYGAGDQAAGIPVQSEAFIVQPRTFGVGFEYLFFQ